MGKREIEREKRQILFGNTVVCTRQGDRMSDHDRRYLIFFIKKRYDQFEKKEITYITARVPLISFLPLCRVLPQDLWPKKCILAII